MEKLVNGTNLGAFRILHQIGEGGMAKVFKAYQPSMERYVALKVLPSHYASDPQFIERFNREARTIARLEHRHILPVYDFGEQEGVTFLAMRLVEGGTLKELLSKGRLTLHDTLELINQICSALDYAHRHNVVHRDIKPSNVMLDSEGAVYLTDFGIAKVLEAAGDLTASGTAIGTPAYMAPEQAMGNKVDGRTDLYALGVVLYEMVVGKVPFHADTPMAVLMAHIHEPLPLPRDQDSKIPEAVEAVIIKAVAKDPADRYQTANEMAQALRQAIYTSAPEFVETTLLNLIQEVRSSRPTPPVTEQPATPPPTAIALDPRLPERLAQFYTDGLSAYWVRDWQKARLNFQAVVAQDPQYKDTSARLAEVEKQIRLAELYAQAQEAIAHSDWKAAEGGLSELVAMDGQYEQAAALLKTAQRKLELAELYHQAEHLHQAGQWAAVLKVFERIHSLEADSPDPQGLLAAARKGLIEQQRQDKLKASYERGLQALEAGKWKDAQRLFEQIKAQQPNYGDTEQLLQRIAAERTRQRQKPASEATKTAISPADVPTAVSPGPAGGKMSPRVRLALGLIGLVVIGTLIVAGVLGRSQGWFGGPAATPIPGADQTGQAAQVPATQPPTPLPPMPAQEWVYDDFNGASAEGALDPDRWSATEGCSSFSINSTRLVQEGILRLVNQPRLEIQHCQFWMQKGERVPGKDLGALEARLQFADLPPKGDATSWIALQAGTEETNNFRVACGLRAKDGRLIQNFIVWGQRNQQAQELYYRMAPAEAGQWYTIQIRTNPENMAFECLVNNVSLGVFVPPDPVKTQVALFGRFLDTERGANVEAGTFFDDVRLIPGNAAQQPAAPAAGQPSAQVQVECPTIKGWKAEYWGNPGLNGAPELCQDEPILNHEWEYNAPAKGLPPDHFSARFTRTLEFAPGSYRFVLSADDGARLSVDGKIVINEWQVGGFRTFNKFVDLEAGAHTVVVEYFEEIESASLSLGWALRDGAVAGCLPPPEGMVSWLTGDGYTWDEITQQSAHFVTHAQYMPDTLYMPGEVGQAFSLSSEGAGAGMANEIWADLPPNLQKASAATLELWVYLNPGATRLNQTERFVTFGPEAFVLRKENDGRLHFYMQLNGELHPIWSKPELPRGEFIHVAGTYDGQVMRLYWNGQQAGYLTVNAPGFKIETMSMSSGGEALDGLLDEISTYNRALSTAEIKAIFQAGQAGKCKP